MNKDKEAGVSKMAQTCVPPLVSFQLIRAGKTAAAVCEVTPVGFLPWKKKKE